MSVRFKVNEVALRKLLVGETVKVKGAHGEEIEFFLEDVGLFKLQQIFEATIDKVTVKLTGG